MTSEIGADGIISINTAIIEECVQKKSITYDKSGDSHYDNISAFIKSMRGSDPDAAIFYLARAIHAGEDPEFLARRIIICASEDVGMANPTAFIGCCGLRSCQDVGMPKEGLFGSCCHYGCNKSQVQFMNAAIVKHWRI
jgi:putative ATPase